jgi:DNA-binding beta-propeller fold protein YncE
MSPRPAALALACLLAAAAGPGCAKGAPPASSEAKRPASAAPVASPERTLIVLNKDDATASFVDLATLRVRATAPTGQGPHEVAVSPDGRLAAVANYGAQEPGGTLTLLDVERRAAAKTIDLREHRRPHGIAWLADGRRVVVTSETSRALLVVDTASGAVARVPTLQEGTHMVALSPDRRLAYTANIKSSSISVVDLEGQSLVRTVPAPERPEGIDVSPDGREVWAAPIMVGPRERGEGSVVVFDARTLEQLATFPSGGETPNRLRFTPDGRRVLVSNAASGNVTIFDAKARAPLAAVELPRDLQKAPVEPDEPDGPFARSAVPLGILVAGDSRRAFVATAAHDEVVVIDVEAHQVVDRVRTGKAPDGMAFSSLAVGP